MEICMANKARISNSGAVVAVQGSVVDIYFEDHLPPIYTLLKARMMRLSLRLWRSLAPIGYAGLP